MREIKFRAWDIQGKKIILVNELTFFQKGNIAVNGIVFPEFPIMQSTGLKDKNDKEIYEGDIVEMNEPIWTWKIQRRVRVEFLKCIYPFNILDESHWEVIGNIYENPNLLIQEK